MAIYASTSTITTQTVPLIMVDPSSVQDEYFLIWDDSVGAFVAKPFEYVIDLDTDQFDGVLPPVYGGTGIDNYNDGDLLFGNNNSLSKLSIGNNGQFLTVENNLPVWKNINRLNNLKSIINQSFSTSTEPFTDQIPENSKLMNITIYIEDVYNSETTISISDDSKTILDNSIIKADSLGSYIYSINEEYSSQTVITTNIQNATQGSMKIFLEYTIL